MKKRNQEDLALRTVNERERRRVEVEVLIKSFIKADLTKKEANLQENKAIAAREKMILRIPRKSMKVPADPQLIRGQEKKREIEIDIVIVAREKRKRKRGIPQEREDTRMKANPQSMRRKKTGRMRRK